MFKFVSKALLPLVMDKEARKKLQTLRGSGNGSPPEAAPPESERPPAEKREMTPEREELIRQAKAVHRAKAKILDDLSEEDRRKLHDVALRELRRAQKKKGGG
ncbi:MAG: hypothetical protein QGI63_06160 [Rhodospirillales bacterium]|jgi:small-conductance mechanosensitive channel|nr:hypothetical protein [Rhodospirillales bacterium]MDP6773836.1 hypothetical protein [Rhodospirillales bacterium]|tara:strand:- start:275 stop:583 length:309 start_codon:yes stop_codon:yes gene_type:complete